MSSIPIAFTDLETTGTDPIRHEILEIGLLVVEPVSLGIVDSLEVKVKPEHIATATDSALELNGYNARDWANAVPLKRALEEYVRRASSAIFCSHNVTFDWAFMNEGFRKTGVVSTLNYHRLDLFTMAWVLLRPTRVDEFHLGKVAQQLGIREEPLPHRARNGAQLAYEVFKRLESRKLGSR
jgi:DNA polymerase-3 subunit epsilon